MTLVINYLRELYQASVDGWNRFWFTPSDPATLGLIRLLAGAMLFYTHLVWTLELEAFFGPNAWISPQAAVHRYTMPIPGLDGETTERLNIWYWSHWWLIDSPEAMWAAHFAALAVFAMFALGLFTRVTSVLAFLLAVSYCNRLPTALFGLDQINCMLAMYLMVGPSGAAYSLDHWWARRQGRAGPIAAPSTSATIAIRLIQLHMCVIYFFAGLGKLQGGTWWRGDALWGAVANLEYQTWDATWLVAYPVVITLLTHITTFWELFFCAIVWPRLLRPLVLFVAIPLHMGIGLGMGMMTFGLIMLVGCSSFVPPWLIRRIFGPRADAVSSTSAEQPGRAGQGGPATKRQPLNRSGQRAKRS